MKNLVLTYDCYNDVRRSCKFSNKIHVACENAKPKNKIKDMDVKIKEFHKHMEEKNDIFNPNMPIYFI